MEKVFLRVYDREIGSMIEGGKLDEAAAHCQHILKTFPMHIETYRLLGKAILESRRYADAADIFQRILMSVPDDFMSHVGMSIIRDNEGSLDDAIWYMERAFEIQPSNSSIQGELRHLYGRRDGVEPLKIRLGRDALANMYLQGELCLRNTIIAWMPCASWWIYFPAPHRQNIRRFIDAG
jgi:tetratricopeptide (TPR) repeat protein